MKKIILLGLLLLSNILIASEREVFSTYEGTKIVIQYHNQGKWFLEEYLVRPGKLQEKIQQLQFSNLSEMYQYKNTHYLNLLKSDFEPEYSSTEDVNSFIWEATGSWNLEWEEKYSNWLIQEFTPDFFQKYQISTDCADVAFALRWIFARINGLPAANTLAATEVIFSHESMKEEWRDLPRSSEWYNDQLFMTALKYLLENAYTGTLNIDTYPIEITRDSFKIGTIHLLGGHTQIIAQIDYSGSAAPIRKYSSTVPSAIRVLDDEIMFDSDATSKEDGGIVRMRWPVKADGTWSLVPKKEMPLYSLEQYDEDFLGESGNFTMAIIEHLKIPFVPAKVIHEAGQTLLDKIVTREAIVRGGYEFCKINDCEEGSFNYEEYSTPTRDGRIAKLFDTINELVGMWTDFDRKLPTKWKKFLAESKLEIEGIVRPLSDYQDLFRYKLLSYHPEDSIEERWAMGKEAVFSAFSKKITRILDKRQKRIIAGIGCIGNNACARSTDLWKEFHTYAMDEELKNEGYAVYFYLLEKYGQAQLQESLNKSFVEQILRVPGFISEPTADIARRNGEQIEQMGIHLGLVNKLVELVSGNAIVDDKIVKIRSGEVLRRGLGKKYLVDDMNNIIIQFKNNQFTLYDSRNAELVGSYELGFKVEEIAWIGDGVFLGHDCKLERREMRSPRGPRRDVEDEDCQAKFYKISGRSVEFLKREQFDPFRFWNITSQHLVASQAKAQAYLSNGNGRKLFFTSNGKLESIDIESGVMIQDISSFGNLLYWSEGSNDEEPTGAFLMNRMTRQVCSLPILKGKIIQEVFNNRFILAQDYEGGNFQLLKLKENCQAEVIKSYQDEWTDMMNVGSVAIIRGGDGIDVIHNDDHIQITKNQNEQYVGMDGSRVLYGKYIGQVNGFEYLFAYDLESRVVSQVDITNIPIDCGQQYFSRILGCSQTKLTTSIYQNYEGGILNFFLVLNDTSGQPFWSELRSFETGANRAVRHSEEVVEDRDFYYYPSGVVISPAGTTIFLLTIK